MPVAVANSEIPGPLPPTLGIQQRCLPHPAGPAAPRGGLHPLQLAPAEPLGGRPDLHGRPPGPGRQPLPGVRLATATPTCAATPDPVPPSPAACIVQFRVQFRVGDNLPMFPGI